MTLRLWLRHGLEVIFYSCVLCVFYLLMQLLFGGGFNLQSMPLYLLLSCGIFLPIMTLSSYTGYLSVYLSFGSTRRACLAGMHLMRLAAAAGTALLAGMLALLFGNRIVLSYLPGCFLAVLCLGTLGSLIGCLCQRFPRAGKLISVISLSVFFGLLGFFGGFLMTGAETLSADSLHFLNRGLSVILLICVLLLGADLLLQTSILRRYEVKGL